MKHHAVKTCEGMDVQFHVLLIRLHWMETKEKFNAQSQYPRQRPQYQIETRLGV